MRKKIMITIVALTLVLSVYYYNLVPSRMVTHWDASGQANGYMDKEWGLFLLPLIMLVTLLLFLAIPRIDPLKRNIQSFRKDYDIFVIFFLVFMLVVHIHTILWNVGLEVKANFTFPVGIGLLFVFIGELLKKSKRNWFIGIRTPWTLSSDEVWDKTNKLGSKLFKVCGVIAILSVFARQYSTFFILVPVVSATLICFVYSYIEYRKLKLT